MRHAPAVSDEYGSESPAEDDFAAMLASLDGRIERRELARALGVKKSELDLIEIGHAPKPETADRLRAVYALSQRTEGNLDDPRELMKSLGALSSDGEVMVPLSLMPRIKTFFVAFVVIDAIVFAAVTVVFLLAR